MLATIAMPTEVLRQCHLRIGILLYAIDSHHTTLILEVGECSVLVVGSKDRR